MTTISENLQGVRTRIACAARSAKRDPSDVRLLAVSKTHPAARIAEAHAAGQEAFGENYVQDALAKMDALPPLEWHLIGPLQSNKTRVAAERFDWVQTVASERVAARLSAQRPRHRPPLNVLIQVNVSRESTKSGVAPEEVPSLGAAIVRLPRLRLRGLMAIPEPGAQSAEQFAQMRELYERLRAEFGLDTLSMGMSDDLEAAIAQGSTMVRIGTAIFGKRQREESAA